jgi:hypothetical protein
LLPSVARALEAALHAKVLTFGGTEEPQIRAQQGSLPSGLLLELPNEHCAGRLLKTKWYADRTVKQPDFSGCHARTSENPLLDGLILRMASPSIG